MWEFIKGNHGAIGAIATVLTLGIWALYLQLLLNSYRHRVRPKININRGGGHTNCARCIVTNMSVESVYLEGVFVTLWKERQWLTCSLSDLDNGVARDADYRSQLFQGPLGSGEMIDLGSFDELMVCAGSAAQAGEALDGEADRADIMVVATYTGSDELVAAERRYDIAFEDGQRLLKPTEFSTRQMRSRMARRNIEQLMLDWYKYGTSRRRPGE